MTLLVGLTLLGAVGILTCVVRAIMALHTRFAGSRRWL